MVLLAPYLGHAAPTTRPGSGGWVQVGLPRVIGLSILNRFGVHQFDGLPTLAFAGPPGRPPRVWSYRLMQDFGPSGRPSFRDTEAWRADAAKLAGRLRVLVGTADESMNPAAYGPAFQSLIPAGDVRLLSGVGHIGITNAPSAVEAIAAALR